MIQSSSGFGVLSLRKKNSLGKKRVDWIIYHLYKLKSAEKAVLDQTLNHDCFYILILKIVTLQCGKISIAQKLDTGKDSAVKVPEVSLFLLYKRRCVYHLKPKAITFVWSLWLALCYVGHCHICLLQQTCS